MHIPSPLSVVLYLAVVHPRSHHPLVAHFLQGWFDSEAVPQVKCDVIAVADHFHGAVEDHAPRVQLQQREQ